MQGTSVGLPLDVVLRSELRGVGEFHRSVLDFGTTTTEWPSPVRTVFPNPNPNPHHAPTRAKPFANPFVAPNPSSNPTQNVSGATALSERVIVDPATGTIWWSEGGAGNGSADDHSRIVRFDRTGPDDPTTMADERLCAYDVPETKNEVYGLAAAGVASGSPRPEATTTRCSRCTR